MNYGTDSLLWALNGTSSIDVVPFFVIPASGTFAVKPAKEPSSPHRDRLLFSRPSLFPARQTVLLVSLPSAPLCYYTLDQDAQDTSLYNDEPP